MGQVGTVAGLYRFPVKSMLGEQLDEAELTDRGVAGDRAYAVLDRQDGRIATGKHPRKWSKLLELAASYVDGVGSPVAVTFPGGEVVRSDSPAIDAALSTYLDREVALVHTSVAGQVIEEVWPDIDGLAPAALVASMSGGRREGDDPVSDVPMASMAPAGTFFDLTTLHVLTTATLRRLAGLAPAADFDVRRYRPNVLVEVEGAGFVENDWTGSTLEFGATAEAHVDLPTMRCVMTTLARDEMATDRASLKAIARHNRVEIAGMGTWACAGVYASISAPGRISLGEPVGLTSGTRPAASPSEKKSSNS
jgi:uncharacterized protein YcbX